MAGPDIPDYNDLDPDSLSDKNRPGPDPSDESSGEGSWDWHEPELSGEAVPIESPGLESASTDLVDGPQAVGYTGGPAARNGKNGHGGPTEAMRAPAHRSPQGRKVMHPSRLAAKPDDNRMTIALLRATMKAEDGQEASLMAAAITPLVFDKVVSTAKQQALQPALPALMKGVAVLAALLVEEDARSLIRLLPKILEETFQALGRAVDERQPITRELAGDVLAEKTAAIVRGPGRHEENARRTRGERRPSTPLWYSEEMDGDDGDDAF